VEASLAKLIADCKREDDANLGVRIRGPGSSVTTYLSLSPARWSQESLRKRLNFELTMELKVHDVSSYVPMTTAFVIHEYFAFDS
jgi:hypothetical protein